MDKKVAVAQALLNVGAVKLNVAEPFTFTSGIKSPIYCDNRKMIGSVEERNTIIEGFIELLNVLDFDVVAGTATAGIPWAAFIADRINKPMAYIRSKPKDYGAGKQIEGPDVDGKRMKKVFTNPFSKWLFRWLHPDIGVKLGQYLSVKNKLISGVEDVKYLGEDQEWLVQYCKRKLETKSYNFFVFGHRHLPLEIELTKNSKYINLGDWIGYFTYGVFDGTKFELKKFER